MNVFALSFALMLALVLLEQWLIKRRTAKPVPWKDLVFNLNSGHLLMWVLRGAEIAAYGFTLEYASVQWVSHWPIALQWVFALIAWDFCFYWMHRMHHKIPLLWAVHCIHHQGEHFNLSLAVRNGWYSSLTNFPFIAMLAVLGVPVEIFIAVSSLHYSVQLYNHNALVRRSGILDKFLVTPSNHRVHHGMHECYIDRNFGGTLLLWDRIFGTWQPEREDLEMRFGVNGGIPSQNPLWANNPWLWHWLRKQRFALKPLRTVDWPGAYIGCGGVILFLLVIAHIDGQPQGPVFLRGCNLIALILSTIALGALSDGKRWGAVAWVGFCLGLPSLFFLAFDFSPHWLYLPYLLLLAHGFDGARRLLLKTEHNQTPREPAP
jgi:sterol desaturase/sphingolipid hydroxylase (fatty acid hydroxylase superfamily)